MDTLPPLRTPNPPRVIPTVQLLRIGEAAARLAISNRTLRRLAAEGEVRYLRIGRSLRFAESDLAKLIDAHRVGGDW